MLLEDIDIIHAVTKTGSFSQAAKELHLSRPALPKRDLIPLDVNKVIELNAARGDLDPLPETIADLNLEGVADLVGRNSLSMKHETAEDLIRATRNDMG